MKVRKLNQFLHQPTGQFRHSRAEFHRDGALWPALGTIDVIFAKFGNDVGSSTRVMSMSRGSDWGARD